MQVEKNAVPKMQVCLDTRTLLQAFQSSNFASRSGFSTHSAYVTFEAYVQLNGLARAKEEPPTLV